MKLNFERTDEDKVSDNRLYILITVFILIIFAIASIQYFVIKVLEVHEDIANPLCTLLAVFLAISLASEGSKKDKEEKQDEEYINALTKAEFLFEHYVTDLMCIGHFLRSKATKKHMKENGFFVGAFFPELPRLDVESLVFLSNTKFVRDLDHIISAYNMYSLLKDEMKRHVEAYNLFSNVYGHVIPNDKADKLAQLSRESIRMYNQAWQFCYFMPDAIAELKQKLFPVYRFERRKDRYHPQLVLGGYDIDYIKSKFCITLRKLI